MPLIRIAYYSDESTSATQIVGADGFNANPSGYNEIIVEQATIDLAMNPADVIKGATDKIVAGFKDQIDLAFTPQPAPEG